MSDLETRLRDGLQGDVEHRDVDMFLTGVHRRSAWRRARHAAAGVAAVVVAIVGSSVAVQHGRDHGSTPTPVGPTSVTSSAASQPRGRVVDLEASGSHVFRLTTHDGCTHCNTVWERTSSGQWQRLGDLHGGSREWGPAQLLDMAPNGRDGWAWEPELWSTHDGGRTWAQVTDGPGRRTSRGHQVAIGAHAVWSVWTSPSGRMEVWRSPLGSDDWQQVPTPIQGDLVGVTSTDEVVLHETNEGAGGAVVVLGPAGTPTRYVQPFTSDVRFLMGGDSVYARHGTTASRLDTTPVGGEVRGWQPIPRLPAGAITGLVPIDVEHLLVGTRTGWWLVMPGGTVRGDLPHGTDVDRISATNDGTVWLTTYSSRVYTSTDGGAHWQLLTPT
jgi:hypothetical protein